MEDDKKIINILLVEDNPGDVRLTQEAFRECKHIINLHVVGDGTEVFPFLNKEGKYADKPRPDMIFLDLNLPKKDGCEVLAEIKEDEKYRTIPVVILTTSKAEEDIIKTYDLHANCFLSKPVDIVEFKEMIKTTEDFWSSSVILQNKSI